METIKDNELRVRVLLSTYRAILGMIPNDIRLVTIDWGVNHYVIKAYFDRPVNDDDFDLLKVITTEVAADFPQMINISEDAEFSSDPIEKISALKELVFLRYGELKFK
jgi:hypothetical protein